MQQQSWTPRNALSPSATLAVQIVITMSEAPAGDPQGNKSSYRSRGTFENLCQQLNLASMQSRFCLGSGLPGRSEEALRCIPRAVCRDRLWGNEWPSSGFTLAAAIAPPSRSTGICARDSGVGGAVGACLCEQRTYQCQPGLAANISVKRGRSHFSANTTRRLFDLPQRRTDRNMQLMALGLASTSTRLAGHYDEAICEPWRLPRIMDV